MVSRERGAEEEVGVGEDDVEGAVKASQSHLQNLVALHHAGHEACIDGREGKQRAHSGSLEERSVEVVQVLDKDAQRRWRVHVEDGRGARSDGGLTDGKKRVEEGRESAHMLALLQRLISRDGEHQPQIGHRRVEHLLNLQLHALVEVALEQLQSSVRDVRLVRFDELHKCIAVRQLSQIESSKTQ